MHCHLTVDSGALMLLLQVLLLLLLPLLLLQVLLLLRCRVHQCVLDY